MRTRLILTFSLLLLLAVSAFADDGLICIDGIRLRRIPCHKGDDISRPAPNFFRSCNVNDNNGKQFTTRSISYRVLWSEKMGTRFATFCEIKPEDPATFASVPSTTLSSEWPRTTILLHAVGRPCAGCPPPTDGEINATVMPVPNNTVPALESTIHVAVVVQVSANTGYVNPSYGVTAGGLYRSGNFAATIDAELLRVKKAVGGTGYSEKVRGGARFYFNKNVFAEGDVQFSHYAVTQFSKSNVYAGGGLGWSGVGWTIKGLYFRHISESSKPVGTLNHQDFAEASVEGFLPRHFYLKSALAISRFTSHPPTGIERLTGETFTVAVGFWK